MPEQVAKTCIWCKQDCSTKPRQKDLKGNYLCKKCVEPYRQALTARAKARRPERTPTTPAPSDSTADGGDVLVGMIDQTIDMDGEACPSCSRVLALDAVICTHCGYNKNTGRQIRSHIIREKGPKESKEKASMNLSMSPGMLFLLLTLIMGGLAGGGMVNEGLLMALMGMWLLLNFVANIGVIIMAFMHSVGQGLLTLCLPLYSIYFTFFVNENGYLKVVMGWMMISYLLMFALVPDFGAEFMAS